VQRGLKKDKLTRYLRRNKNTNLWTRNCGLPLPPYFNYKYDTRKISSIYREKNLTKKFNMIAVREPMNKKAP